MNTHRRMLRAIGMLLLIVSTGWTGACPIVLCIAPDGHIAIEPGQERCAAPSDAGHQDPARTATGLLPADDCCGPCADVPLRSPVLARARGTADYSEHVETTAAPAWAAAAAASSLPGAVGPIRAGSCATASLSSPAPLTVVLRC